MAYLVTRRVGKYLYRYEVESFRDPKTRRPRQRVLRFLGRVDKQDRVVVAPRARVESVSSAFPVGRLALFYATACELDLVSHIKDVLDVDHNAAVHVLCLILNQIGPRRPLYKLADWVARSPIPGWERLDATRLTPDCFDTALQRLCRVSNNTIEDRGLALQYHMTQVWRGATREPARFYYDVTRQIYYGNDCPYAEHGYFPGGTHKRVLGFGMVTSAHRQHPVLCRAIRGSRNDTVTVEDTVHHLKSWGFKKLTLILDRGMISKDNVEFIVKSGFDLVGLVPENNKEVWDYITRWSDADLERPQYVVERASSGVQVYVRAWNAPLLGRKQMRVALVLDPVRAANERVSRDGLIHAVDTAANPKRLRELREDLGDLAIPAPGRRGFVIDRDGAARERIGDGRFLVFSTNPDMQADEMFRVYFQRDEVEKAFRTLKGQLSLGPIRYRRREHIDAYTTVLYMAYLLWSRTQERLTEKYPTMTVTKALESVEDIHLVRFEAGKQKFEWTTRRSQEQEKIIKLVGADEFLCSDKSPGR